MLEQIHSLLGDVGQESVFNRLARQVLGVQNASLAVPSFLAKRKAAVFQTGKGNPQINQILDPVGSVPQDFLNDFAITKPVPGFQRIVDVLVQVIACGSDRRNTSLGIVGVGFRLVLLRENRNPVTRLGDFEGEAQARDPASYNDEIVFFHSFGAHLIPRDGKSKSKVVDQAHFVQPSGDHDKRTAGFDFPLGLHRLPVDDFGVIHADEGILRQNAHHFRFYPLDVGDPFFLHQQFCGLHRPEQTRGSFPLPGLKIFVTGTHGQAIRFANDGTNHNLNGEIQIGDHFLKHDDLLGILLAKGDKIGQTKIEELWRKRSSLPENEWGGLGRTSLSRRLPPIRKSNSRMDTFENLREQKPNPLACFRRVRDRDSDHGDIFPNPPLPQIGWGLRKWKE